MNQEHILSRKWLAKVMPGIPRVDKFEHRHIRGGGGDDFDNWWKHHEADLKVVCVCEVCNSGWMNDLDLAAQEMTTPMALGHNTELATVSAQTTLAAWAYKVALMCDHLQKDPLVSKPAHDDFYLTKMPPPDVEVWLSKTTPPYPSFLAGTYTVAWTLAGGDKRVTDDSNTLWVSMFVNHLLAHVLIPLSNAPTGLHLDAAHRATFVRRLWPLAATKIVWPPPGEIPCDKIMRFADSTVIAATA